MEKEFKTSDEINFSFRKYYKPNPDANFTANELIQILDIKLSGGRLEKLPKSLQEKFVEADLYDNTIEID